MTLRVTDVQALLRHYANIGHDVISDPRALHLDGQRYGMAVGHSLSTMEHAFGRTIPKGEILPFHSELTSHLMQRERPLVSSVQTSTMHPPSGKNTHIRGVHHQIGLIIPEHLDQYDNKTVYPEEHIYHNQQRHDDSKPGMYSELSSDEASWRPLSAIPYHKSVHEALEAHTQPEVDHMGLLADPPGFGSPTPLTTEEMSKFNHRAALGKLVAPLRPFSGLIHVRHAGDDYTYDPSTEQLMEHRE